ncbi:MAG: PLP-dependent transferase [Syntrophomonadaceae bacterium]|nr:PLP-dependent transferase [Syntrophomonadaceae bacterium]
MGKGTKLIHSGHEVDEATGAVSAPIYQSVIFAQPDVDTVGKWEYTRAGNPTRAVLEETIAELEGGKYGFAFGSGMAAIAAAFFIFSAGDHILVAQDIYGGTFRFVHRLLPRFGFKVEFVDTSDINNIKNAIRPETRALFLETPSNPLMKITDLRAAANLAREHNIVTIADNTLMTPYLQRPLELGIDIVVHSATKYLGGHSDCLAGLVVTGKERLAKEIRFIQNSIGAVLAPHDCWLILRGIKTLKVRMEQQQQTAVLLAEWLSGQPEVVEVFYPGLPGHPGRELHFSQAEGAGGVLSFRLQNQEQARRLINSLHLPVIASSLGAVESIVSLPATMSHAAIPEETRRKLGLTRELVRLSVGLEDFEDLQADLTQALEVARLSQD